MSFKCESWEKTLYFAHGGTGNGESAAQPLPLANSASFYVMPAGVYLAEATAVVTTAVGTASAIKIGDAANDDGLFETTHITQGTKGAYAGLGAYLASSAKKFYETATALAYAQTGSSSAGAMVLVLKGHKVA